MACSRVALTFCLHLICALLVAQLAEALRYKPEGRGSIPDGVICHWHNPSGRTMALLSTQLLTAVSTWNIFLVIKAAGA